MKENVNETESKGTMEERAGTKNTSSYPSFLSRLSDLGVGDRLECGLTGS